MSVELYPLILERTAGTPGAGDAAGRARRITAAQRQDVTAALLGWMPAQSVVVRGATDPLAIALSSNTVLGRGPTGDVRPLGQADLDSLLGLTAAIGTRAPVVHSHTFGEVPGLQAALDNRALLNHLHPPNQVRATGIPDGWIMTASGQLGSWAAPAAGGGLGSPLTTNLDIATFGLVSGASAVLSFSGGYAYLAGRKTPQLAENTGALVSGHTWVFRPGGWVHGLLAATDVSASVPGIAGNTVHLLLDDLRAQILGRALLSHTHPLSQLEVPAGATPGHYLTPKVGGGWELLALPAAGGGVTSPLSANLNLATYALVSGATELLRYSGGQILLGGRAVFPSTITTPAAGHVPVYDAGNADFRNRLLAAAEVTVEAISGLTGSTVQAALASLESTKLETSATTDAVAEGSSATRKYATAASVAAAGAVMVSAISDNGALGSGATTVSSQRAVKEYVDTTFAGVGGSGLARGTSFPGSPSDGELYYRTDYREVFQWVASASSWVGQEREFTMPTTRQVPGTGTAPAPGGSYLLGNGNTYGFRVPFNAFLTGIAFQGSNVDTGTITVRKATEGGSTELAFTASIIGARGVVVAEQFVSVNANQIVSVFANGFSTTVDYVSFTLTYRRRFAS